MIVWKKSELELIRNYENTIAKAKLEATLLQVVFKVGGHGDVDNPRFANLGDAPTESAFFELEASKDSVGYLKAPTLFPTLGLSISRPAFGGYAQVP